MGQSEISLATFTNSPVSGRPYNLQHININGFTMPPSIPDPAFWRPSINESYPRIHVGQHWADKSYSVFCFFERIPDNDNTHPSGPILWAVHPLGDPLLRQPEWIEFNDFIANMPGQTRPGTWAVNINVCQLVTRELRYRYFQQQQLSLDAPVYDAADLARAAQEKKTRRAAAAQMREQQEIMAANRGVGQAGLASLPTQAAQGVHRVQGVQEVRESQGLRGFQAGQPCDSAQPSQSTSGGPITRGVKESKSENDKEERRSENGIKSTVTTRGRSLTIASGAALQPLPPSARPNKRARS